MTYERFLEYIKYPTQSDEECANCPSTGGQLVFAEYLVKELESVGAEQVKMDEHGYVYAALPATEGLKTVRSSDLLHIWIPHRHFQARISDHASFRIMTEEILC